MSVLQGPEFYISKRVGRAIIDYKMLSDGDKIAVAVSGGKDSLTLLWVLNDRKRFVPIKYELLAVHIDLGYPRSCAKALEKYFKKIGVNYHIEKVDILKKTKPKDISCFWCSWNRRKALFETANRFDCTKVALGHHKDDIVETILLNLFFQGEISAMSPKQELFKGKITLIRPLAYVEEHMIKRFAKEEGLPNQTCICSNSLTSKRTKIKTIIRELEKACPDVKTNIFRSVKRIKKDYLL
ncbi:MAG: tRNA 2-thiocytidine(32) synthetase TtcA [Candidatus Omnitrophica bacterium CG08_land_8_20_14_0_20_41_16]|uniref:tRNA 2-thiocytidine(32) synthetase TtcA n=1 Tax=Candidatus Sherwoodlollariibacterium unditelluris TaxID=1974757 RepID=A0A2G9YIU2_9BACT|nr:MAG: tRNA 2-thiocytidine(32) synthetase TtcA [Candidatus Omnitrophica bacterium CG23_combo_of_CG06-09_8_20_14_all_41_10]PIS33879.1 MAG: tRNA 2-thiocytidine(32) synthetase TtcA [Candidatus Omnitrophica bacterium CG08_land_8_20_14_0_20_41_16]